MKKDYEKNSHNSKVKDENSIEYWNEIRAKLKMKQLKESEPSEIDSRAVKLPEKEKTRDQRMYESARKRDSKRKLRSSSSDSNRENQKKNENSIEYWNEK